MEHPVRDRLLRAVTLLGLALVLVTELLSAFHAVRRLPVAVCWLLVTSAAVFLWRRHPLRFVVRRPIRFDPVVVLSVAGCGVILVLTAAAAVWSPPNSTDAMAYHLPRVIYWAEQASVRFFPTQYLNQIMLQPLAEYAMLHLYVLTGGDSLTNLVQWFASLVAIAGVSAVAALFGSKARGQAMAALFCATLPVGVLASSGAKNDYVLAMWLVAAVYFALRFTSDGRMVDAVFLGLALGCALFTKATAYLYAPWLLAAIFLVQRKTPWRGQAAGAAIALASALTLNAPQYWRNYEFSGSVMGFDSAQGDGFFRWRNESIGWKQTVSNVLRNTAEQSGGRSPRWNRAVYDFVVAAHRRLGIDVNDPATTWRWTEYRPPRNDNHETSVPNRWHIAVLLCASAILVWRAARGRDRPRAAYSLALLLGFLSFCAYLKWQLFLGRLFLPLFVAGAPLVGVAGELEATGAPMVAALLQAILSLFLLSNARLPALENWVRPLRGPLSVFHRPRDTQYFADLTAWDTTPSYKLAADALAGSACNTIGLDITDYQIEYPLIALVRETKPQAAFLHAGVENASKRYAQPVAAFPCAVVCFDCEADTKRLELYARFPRKMAAGKFVVLLSE